MQPFDGWQYRQGRFKQLWANNPSPHASSSIYHPSPGQTEAQKKPAIVG